MKSLEPNKDYFYDLMNEIIEISLKESLLYNLERDLKLRYTTVNEKISYLHKLKKDLLCFIDRSTYLQVFQLIDVEKIGLKYVLNKDQFYNFYEQWVNLEGDFEKQVEAITVKNKGHYSQLADEINDLFLRHNAFSPEQITRLSFWMYCLNIHLEEIQASEKFTPNLTIFKNEESHRFFDFLYNDWLKKEEECRPQLSYIVWAMRNNENDLSITCPSLKDFAKFWNNTYSHSFRLTFKNSKINLSDEPSNKYQTAFDNRKQYFKREMMHLN